MTRDSGGRKDAIAGWFAASRVFHLGVRNRYPLQAATDALAWPPALLAAVLFRYEFAFGDVRWGRAFLFGVLMAELQVAFGVWRGLYSGAARYGTFDELPALVTSVAAVVAAGYVANVFWLDRLVPGSAPLGAGPIALSLMVGIRYLWRILWELRLRPDRAVAAPVLVFGAGEAGDQLITAMLRNPESPYVPVGILDDDPRNAVLRLRGVPVLGNRTAIGRVAKGTGARILVIAVPSAPAPLVRELATLAAEAGLEVRILPPVSELLDGGPTIADVRPVTAVDLLGRHEVDTDVASIAGYLAGRKVLVTGAGGSIGSELCRQISRFEPALLMMLDRDESALHALQLMLEGRALLDAEMLVVADIRDAERMNEVFTSYRPDVVFHAAALKHLTLLERHPGEGWKTNVMGTQNVLDAALSSGVDRFVNISTDKSADPTSVLGYSKRIAERLTASAGRLSTGTYLSVRFGNVLGSRGSVLASFRHQIDAGGPVTVTDPEVTRFFMTIEEACQLVIQAGAIGRNGEALVLDMGEPVRIADVARQLIEASGRAGIEIEFCGLRPGEKLHEVLIGTGERDDRPFHPLVAHLSVPPLSADAVRNSYAPDTLASVLEELARSGDEFAPSYRD